MSNGDLREAIEFWWMKEEFEGTARLWCPHCRKTTTKDIRRFGIHVFGVCRRCGLADKGWYE